MDEKQASSPLSAQSETRAVTPSANKKVTDLDFSQWQVGPNGKFRPATQTIPHLVPGVYKPMRDDGGLFLQQQNVITDNIVELPETANVRVLQGMKKFWNSKSKYEKFGFIYKRGVLLWGPPGCHTKGTEVIMYDGTTKKVEDIRENDLLMGPDSTPRRVLALCRGRDDMFRVVPSGKSLEPFDVNGHHVFSLYDRRKGKTVEMTVNDYRNLSTTQKGYLSLWQPEGGFDLPTQSLPVDPQELDLIQNKHIPDIYLRGDRIQRLRLLAGLLDTDGNLTHGEFEITQKRKLLAEQIVFLARSLGYGASIRPVIKTIKSRNFSGKYWRVGIHGKNLSQIPTRLSRKQVESKTFHKKNTLHTRIKNVQSLGIDDYYGFELDGDHLYETKDFIVFHNSGKSVTINLLMKELINLDGIVLLCSDPELMELMLQRIRLMEPDRPIIVVMEDIDEMIERHQEHSILSMLDGENQIANVVYVATSNYPERLGARIVNRPSRFDERIFVGMPSDVARRAYLLFATRDADGEAMSKTQLDQWVKDTKNFSVAHLRELVAASYCLDQPYEEVLKRLKSMTEKPKFVDGFRKGNTGFLPDEDKDEDDDQATEANAAA